jgi:hypothetical protein
MELSAGLFGILTEDISARVAAPAFTDQTAKRYIQNMDGVQILCNLSIDRTPNTGDDD